METYKQNLTAREERIAKWGEGEWIDEPDKVEFKIKEFDCLIKRAPMGYLCGYVKIPRDHPWYMKGYCDIKAEVHGGLTFGEGEWGSDYIIGFDCAHGGDVSPGAKTFLKTTERMCTLIGPEIWAQLEEKTKKLASAMEKSSNRRGKSQYRNIAFVKAECERLVDEAIKAMNG